MEARLLAHRKEIRTDGSIIEIVIWQLPEPVPPCKHGYKYRLAYVVNGVCVIRYDNERDKGDHQHVGKVESDYQFTDLNRLLTDFRSDVESWK